MLKQKELLIIASLRKNSRQSLTDMSKRINIPISTIFDRLRIHERTIIRKHTSIIDFSKLGYNLKTKIVIKVHNDDKMALKTLLMKHQSINSVYKLGDGFDFMVEGIFESLKELEDFSDLLDNQLRIENKKIYYVIEDMKREEFLADPQLVC